MGICTYGLCTSINTRKRTILIQSVDVGFALGTQHGRGAMRAECKGVVQLNDI
jgi:lipid-binding SYLF domain-containing protein